MRKYLIILLLVLIIFCLVFWRAKKTSAPTLTDSQTQPAPAQEDTSISESVADSSTQNALSWLAPLDRAQERVTKKPFGIYIDLKNSPVQPERFSGYHTGTDFEIFPEELEAKVYVRAICGGKLILKKTATGYGGVVVQSCNLDNQPITIVYGHLKLSSVAKNIGDDLKIGETIGQLGAAYSPETDGERKHLHLSLHKGSAVNIRGYVQTENELNAWIDTCLYVCN
jgi:hypothetical protein